MDKQKRLRRDRLQNLIILALSVSAIYLFSLTGSLKIDLPQLSLQSAPTEELPGRDSLLQELDWPATLVVSDGSTHRYRQLSTSDSEFTAVEGLWEDLFRQGFSALSVSFADFQSALDLPGIYVAFPSPIPLAILSERLGLPSEDENTLQRLLLVMKGDAVLFYYSDGEQYHLSQSPISTTELLTAIGSIGGSACTFAFQQGNSLLHPLTVLPTELPRYFQLNISPSSGLSGSNELLSFFDFNAHTTNRYMESSGTEVIVEAPRKLSLSPSGRINYLGSTTHVPEGFSLSDESVPSLSELVNGAYHLLTRLSPDSNEMPFYLSFAEYDHSTARCVLRFSHMVQGLPLLSGDGEAAAEFLIENGKVVSLSYLRRSYTASDIPSLLLPLPQASAIATRYEGMELALSYVDSGGDSAAVSWLMR